MLTCVKDYSNKLDEELKKKFKSTFKLSNNNNKFILFLRKVFVLMNMWMIGKSLMLPVSSSEQIEETSQFNEDFIKKL